IFANTVVTMTFELFDSEGTLLEATSEPITYLHGGHSGMLPKLEEALNLKKKGDAISVDVEPADAFGDYDAELVKIEPISKLPSDIQVGMQFEAFAKPARERHLLHGHRHCRRQSRAGRQSPMGGQTIAFRLSHSGRSGSNA